MEGVACGLAGPNEAYLDIIEWLVRSGADAAQRTPPSSQGVWLGEGGSGELRYGLRCSSAQRWKQRAHATSYKLNLGQ